MKTNLLFKTILTLSIFLFSNFIFAQDNDGDGVLDSQETIDGTDTNDPCDYFAFSVTVANTAGMDCDGDGVLDVTELTNGTDPHDACDYAVADQSNPNMNTAGMDCDDDGVLDTTELTNGTDPHDPCSYNVADVTLYNTAGIDCDGDGVLDVTEIADGTDPHDACDYDVADITLANTAGLDCDNDGVDDATELTNGTDPNDACSYLVADQSNPNTNTAGLDCDGDGVLDTTELANGTDPQDPCSYNVVDVTSFNTAGIDCDGDGVLDETEMVHGTDPHDACDYNVVDVTSFNTAGIDCDGDGVLDVTEMADGTDPHNPCDYMVTSQIIASVNSVWLTLDCDGDGVTNVQEISDATDLHDSCDYVLASITLTPTVLCNGNTITGNIKFDYNTNGCDAADFPLSNVMVKSIGGSNTFTTFTNVSGDYTQHTNTGNFSTSASGFSSSYTATPNAQITTFVGVGNTDNIDFCVAPASTVNDLNITVIPMNNPVPSNTVSYQIVYKNVGNIIVNGSVNFTYDNTKIIYQSSSSSPSTTTSNSVSYNYTNLNPYEIRIITVTFLVNSAAIGDILVFSAQVNPVSGDATPYDNTINFAQIVSATLTNRNSNETLSNNNVNDVLVLEGNQVGLQHADEYLHYVIRYQNTNASPINDLIVTTELSDKLDWDTIQLQKQSHNGQVYILNGNQITFKFASINLAAGDQGYIAYSVKPKSDVVVGDVISNQANMYFDFNSVVTTGLISTTITNTAGVNNNNLITDVNIYPNPSKGFINIKATNHKITNVAVYSNLGQVVASFKGVDINTIDLSSLSKGIYFLKLTNKQGSTTVKKVVLK